VQTFPVLPQPVAESFQMRPWLFQLQDICYSVASVSIACVSFKLHRFRSSC